MILLVDVDAVAPLPGLGEVGGLLTVLLASLKSSDQESVGHSYTQQRKPPLTISRMYLLFSFGCATWHVRSCFPAQGWSPCSLQWKRGALTTGPWGKSPHMFSFQLCSSTPCPFFLEYNFYCFLILKFNRWYMSNFRKIRKKKPFNDL